MTAHHPVRRSACAAAMFSLGLGMANASAADVYSQDFESGLLGAEWSGAGTIQDSQGLGAFGFGELHLKNDAQSASLLSLSGLAAHTEVTLSFSLAMWDSIDLGSDFFIVNADGDAVVSETFGNYFPASGSEGPGTALTPTTNGSFTDPQYGYNLGFRDSARAVSVTFGHTASSLVLSFQFPLSQTAPDESFGLDNILVSTNASAVPLPASLPLFGLGVAGLAALRARRKA